MKQALQPNPENQPTLPSQIIKTVLPVVGLCLVLGGGGLVAVFSQKQKPEKVVEKIIQPVDVQTETLRPQSPPYTIFVEGNKTIVKFSENHGSIQFLDLSNEQKVCLANGGGIGCVLPGYQPKLEVVQVEQKPVPKTEVKRQTFKISDIEVSKNTMDNIMVVGGVVLGLLLINGFKK